ncbi:MAG: hypothetical protein GY938_32760 [Ketobacter sp.]|nr:hypothetical protein [Ketobacter sp.]
MEGCDGAFDVAGIERLDGDGGVGDGWVDDVGGGVLVVEDVDDFGGEGM